MKNCIERKCGKMIYELWTVNKQNENITNN